MTTATKPRYDVKDQKLAPQGKKRILWADGDMPVLARIRERFAKEKPLAGLRMSACLHVTCETADLIRTLQAGGADVVVMAAVIVGVDFAFFRNRFWERLIVNIGIVLVFAAFYSRFFMRP